MTYRVADTSVCLSCDRSVDVSPGAPCCAPFNHKPYCRTVIRGGAGKPVIAHALPPDTRFTIEAVTDGANGTLLIHTDIGVFNVAVTEIPPPILDLASLDLDNTDFDNIEPDYFPFDTREEWDGKR